MSAVVAVESGALAQDFERDGYVVFDPAVPVATLDRIAADLEPEFIAADERHHSLVRRLLRRPPKQRFGYSDRIRISDAWRNSADVTAVARAPAVLALLRELYGREPLPFHTLNFLRGTQQPPHADSFHFNSDPPGLMCGVWVALEDVDEASGPLVFYPGSHRLPQVTTADIPMEPSAEEYSKYEAHVAEQLARHGFEPRFGVLKKGQAVVWAADLVHGGAPMENHDSTRRSQVTHYFFEGSRYWTPMLSSAEQVHWRDPDWVG